MQCQRVLVLLWTTANIQQLLTENGKILLFKQTFDSSYHRCYFVAAVLANRQAS